MLFWLFLTVFFGLLTVHPYTTYPVSLAILARLRGHKPVRINSGSRPLSYDVVFCAHNEAESIASKIENCRALAARYDNVRIHVFNDGSSDATADIAAGHADHIRFIDSKDRMGKSAGMNQLLAGCDGEITVFTDANVQLDEDGFAHLARYFSDPDVGCVCGHLIYVNSEESSTASVSSAYWRLEELVKKLESDTGDVMGADGSIFAIRRGLHRKVPDDIIDDFYTSFSILCDGKRVVRAPELMAYERSDASSTVEFRRKVRIACRSFNAHRLLWSRLSRIGAFNLYKYASHKLLRWFSVFWLALAGISALGFAASIGVFWPILGVGVIGGVMLGLLSWLRIRPFSSLLHIVTAYVATGYGIWRSLRGDRFRTWDRVARPAGKDMSIQAKPPLCGDRVAVSAAGPADPPDQTRPDA